MTNRKRAFGLRFYPQVDRQFHEYVNEIAQNLMEEISLLLQLFPKEPISEGDEEVIERLDGSKATMTFDEISSRGLLDNDILIHSRFDELISLVYQASSEMAAQIERSILNTISAAAEEYGNVFNANALTVETVCEMLERANLTFDEDGVMDQMFVISPEMSGMFQQLASDPRVQAIIDRKRREYFAQESD